MFARNLFQVALALALPFNMLAQKETPILLVNPSFEDIPTASRTPSGWYFCGQMKDSPPDVQPGFWEVTTAPKSGSSYMGMVVRDNETWEAVSQRLSRPLEANQCYEMSMDLCKAPKYLSKSPLSVDVVDFATPACILIYGGNGYCDEAQLLAKTTIINHSRWVEYNFRLEPKSNYSFIMIKAYYKTPVLFPYNGHVLVDNVSPIKPVICGPEKMPEKKPTPPIASTSKPAPKTGGVKTVPSTPTIISPAKTEEKPSVAIGKSAKKNVIYRLEKVYFDANKFEVKPESEGQLGELYAFLQKRPDVTIEVGGHTNNAMWPNEAYAIELSTNRAKAVANWLISKGIPSNRVQYRGYGWTKPILPNTTVDGRKKNQRVEATILNSNG